MMHPKVIVSITAILAISSCSAFRISQRPSAKDLSAAAAASQKEPDDVSRRSFSACSTSFAEALKDKTSKELDFQFLCKKHLASTYSSTLLNPLWVGFEMDPAEQRRNAGGRRTFRQDSEVWGNQSSVQSDAFGPQAKADAQRVFGTNEIDLDRGHLAPSYAFTFDKAAFDETYLMTNVAPQAGKFNRVSWRITEEHLSDYSVATNRKLWVVVGTAYDNILDPPRIDGTAIPSYFWMAICSPELGQSTAKYGRNVQENNPEGMLDFIPIAELLNKSWMQQVIPGASIFGDKCGESAGDAMLDLGNHKKMDQASDVLRTYVKPSKNGSACVPTGAPVVLWHYMEPKKGWDKKVSVKNLGDTPVSMESFSIRLALNGGGWDKTIQLPDTVKPAGGVFSIAHSRSKLFAATNLGADLWSSSLMFNGNDAVGLFECGELVDVIGATGMAKRMKGNQLSAEARRAWKKKSFQVNEASTTNHVLYRKLSTEAGCTEWFEGNCQQQWETRLL